MNDDDEKLHGKRWKLDPQSSCDESDWLTQQPSLGTKTSCTLSSLSSLALAPLVLSPSWS